MKILLLYYTKTGHTLEAIQAIAEGVRTTGAKAEAVTTRDFDASKLAGYDGLIVGSPCWAGSVTPNGVSIPVSRALKNLPADALATMRCGGVSVHSGFGGKTTVASLGKMLTNKGCKDYRPGPAARAGTPFSILRGPAIKDPDLNRFREFGASFAGE